MKICFFLLNRGTKLFAVTVKNDFSMHVQGCWGRVEHGVGRLFWIRIKSPFSIFLRLFKQQAENAEEKCWNKCFRASKIALFSLFPTMMRAKLRKLVNLIYMCPFFLLFTSPILLVHMPILWESFVPAFTLKLWRIAYCSKNGNFCLTDPPIRAVICRLDFPCFVGVHPSPPCL